MIVRFASIVICLVTLAACGTTALHAPAVPWPAMGWTLELHADVAVPADHARVFVQDGKALPRHRVDTYRPHCNLEQRPLSDGVSEGRAVIRADRFVLTRVRAGEDLLVGAPPLQYDSRMAGSYLVRHPSMHRSGHHPGYYRWHLVEDDVGVPEVSRYLHFYLASDRQPQVMRLTCHGGFELAGRARLPGMEDILRALGNLMTLEPAAMQRSARGAGPLSGPLFQQSS